MQKSSGKVNSKSKQSKQSEASEQPQMKILYSKQSTKTLLIMEERKVAKILENLKGIVNGNPKIKPTVLSGYAQKRYVFEVKPYYVIAYRRVFKGEEVFYCSQILHEEDYEYFLN